MVQKMMTIRLKFNVNENISTNIIVKTSQNIKTIVKINFFKFKLKLFVPFYYFTTFLLFHWIVLFQ